MEKLISLLSPLRQLLFVTMLLGINITALADDHCDFTVNDINYIFIGGTTDEVAVSYREYESGRYGGYYNYYTGSVTVPATVTYNSKTYKVTAVGSHAFTECYSLTSVSLPNTITSIGSYAFGDCNKLTAVNVPQTVKRIGQGAFSGCVSLYSVSIPKEVTSIAASTFENCRALSSVVIPENVKTIGTNAFKGCSNLYSITIPNDVESVGADAFYGTSWLSNRPTGMLYVGKVAYKYVGTMPLGTELALKEGTMEISSSAFSGCSGLESIDIPESVVTIGTSAFSGCTSLKSITIPKSVTSMGGNTSNSAFYGCSALKDVTILCPNVGKWWFREVDAIERVVFGDAVKTIGYGAFYFCKGITSITIPESVTNIYNEAFYICSNLASVTIANSQASIAYDAFYGTPWMDNQPDGLIYIGQVAYRYKGEMPEGTRITIKDGTIEIADHAFYSCSGMSSILIPNSVRIIGSYAFSGCSALESISIPEGTDSIGNYAFQYCRGLLSASIPGSAKSIGYSAFSNCDNLSSVILSEGVTDIGTSMFASCKNLESIVIPTSLRSIGNSAFSGCSSLSSITISKGVKTIGQGAFQGCSSLSSICIPQSVVTISPSSFSGCTALADVSISKGVKTIDYNSFRGCSNLTTITIPSSVDSIGDAAFADCSLATVTVKAKDPLSINPSVFSYYSNYTYYSYANIAVLYVPEGCKAAYEAVDVWKTFKDIIELPNDYSLYGTNLEILRGNKVMLPIILNNEEEVKLCQFDLRLPNGVTVAVKSNGKLDAKLTERAESHSVSSTRLSNGDYRFVISSMDNDSFIGNEGTLLEITLDVAEDMEAGEYTVKVLNAELSVPDGNDLKVVKPADTESKLIVKAYTPGDVNNDGSVSVTDVGCAINYILEQVPSVFIFEAADMNGDKSISVTDVGLIINMILNEGAASRSDCPISDTVYGMPTLMANADGYLLAFDGQQAFTAFQMDIAMSAGNCEVSLSDKVADSHLLTCRKLSDGHYRVVCYSLTNEPLPADMAELLHFVTNSDIALTDIRFTTVGLSEVSFDDMSAMTTGIVDAACSQSSELKVYTLDGRLCRTIRVQSGENPLKGLKAGIYMIGNRKVIVK